MTRTLRIFAFTLALLLALSCAGFAASGEPDAGTISIHDGRIELIEKGTAIAVGNNAKVDVDRVVVWNKGNADGVSASGSAEMNVRDTVVYGEQPARRSVPVHDEGLFRP